MKTGEEQYKCYSIYIKLLLIFITYRSFQYLVVFSTPNEQFDTSTQLFLKQIHSIDDNSIRSFWNKNLWNKLLSWDSIFFIKGITKDLLNYSEFEYELMFSRLWIQIIRLLLMLIRIRIEEENFYQILRFSVLIENILHFMSIIIIYHLTLSIYSESTVLERQYTKYSERIALISAILFIFTSGAGFFTSIYSEPLSSFLTFVGIWLRELCITTDTKRLQHLSIQFKGGGFQLVYFLGTTSMFTLAALNRSNCILLGLFYLYDLFCLVINAASRNHSFESSFTSLLQIILYPLLSGVTMLTIIIYHWYYIPFQTFCPKQGEWCETPLIRNIPFITKQSFYSFIQSKYWNVGFLNYWTLGNIPNFLLALPQFLILIKSIQYFNFNKLNRKNLQYTILPLNVITFFFLFIILFIAHVQIINRVATFIPLHLWYIAELITSQKLSSTICQAKEGNRIIETKHNKIDRIMVKFYLGWLFFWTPIQTVLFGLFLPPA